MEQIKPGHLTPAGIELFLTQRLSWAASDLWAALYDAEALGEPPVRFSDIASLLCCQPVPVPDRHVRKGTAYAGAVQFETFGSGFGSAAAIYLRTGTFPLIFIQPGLTARPSRGPVWLRWNQGVFDLWSPTTTDTPPESASTPSASSPSTDSPAARP